MHVLEAALVSNLAGRLVTNESTFHATVECPRFRTQLRIRLAAAIAVLGVVMATLDIATMSPV